MNLHCFLLVLINFNHYNVPYSGKVWGEGKFGESTFIEHLAKESLVNFNRSANRLLIVITKLDGFSLANHGRFTKFAKLPCYTVIASGFKIE